MIFYVHSPDIEILYLAGGVVRSTCSIEEAHKKLLNIQGVIRLCVENGCISDETIVL